MRRLALAATILGALWSAASAQELQRIAAIVNEDVISMYDLNARIELIVVTSRLPDTQEMRRRIQPQILRAMIDERLELQEAKRRNVSDPGGYRSGGQRHRNRKQPAERRTKALFQRRRSQHGQPNRADSRPDRVAKGRGASIPCGHQHHARTDR